MDDVALPIGMVSEIEHETRREAVSRAPISGRPTRKRPMMPYDSPAPGIGESLIPPDGGIWNEQAAAASGVFPMIARPAAWGMLLGGALIATGIAVAGSKQEFAGWPAWARGALADFLLHNEAALAGGVLMLVGIVLAGAFGRKALPDRLAGLSLPLTRLRLDAIALAAFALGVGCEGLVYWHLASNQYTHLDIGFFFAGFVLVGFGIHRLEKRTASTLRLTWVDAALGIGLAALSAAINSVNLVHWSFSWVGDEGSFFHLAHAIANGETEWNYFDLVRVHSAHPVADSAYQALALKVFGDGITGWRLGEVVVVALCAVLTYLLGTALFGRLAGLAAGVIVGTSHYLMAFTRIGYNSLHALFFATLAMLMLVLAWRTQRAVFVYATGVALGLCLYTFQVGLLTGPIVAALLLVIFLRRPGWGQVMAGALMLSGFGQAVVPGLLVTPFEKLMSVVQHNTYVPQLGLHADPVVQASLVDSTAAFWLNEQWRNHYIAGPLVDPITGTLLAMGLGIALFRINKRAERLAFVWFTGGLLLIAFTRLIPEAHITRLLYLVPAVALLAALTVTKLVPAIRDGFGLPSKVAQALVLVPLALVPALNLHIIHVQGPATIASNSFVLLMKVLEENPEYRVTEAGVAPAVDENLAIMLSLYPSLAGRYSYVQYNSLGTLHLKGRELTAESRRIFFVNDENRDIVPAVQSQLPESFSVREVTDPPRVTRVWLFAVGDIRE